MLLDTYPKANILLLGTSQVIRYACIPEELVLDFLKTKINYITHGKYTTKKCCSILARRIAPIF